MLEGGLRGRDFDRGRNLFHATACVACHRFDGEGGDIGPDLSSLSNKFAIGDLLEAILEPSKVISDQYGSSIVTRKDGTTAFGRVVERGDDGLLEVYSSDPAAPAIEIDRAEVRSIEPSPISQMPPGLVNALNADELKDLVAYLMSRGDRDDAAFRK